MADDDLYKETVKKIMHVGLLGKVQNVEYLIRQFTLHIFDDN